MCAVACVCESLPPTDTPASLPLCILCTWFDSWLSPFCLELNSPESVLELESPLEPAIEYVPFSPCNPSPVVVEPAVEDSAVM